MQLKRKLTLKDMANQVGVSTATISNAFNRPNQLSVALREKILEECRRAGYAGPNAAARSLRTGRTGIVGVMLSNYLAYSFSDPVAQQFLQGVAEVFEGSEYSLLVIPSRDHVKPVRGYESFVDGYIVYGPPQDRILEQLQVQNKAIIAVDFDVEGHVSVNVDNYAAAKKCAQHALADVHELGAEQQVVILGLRLIAANRICRIQDDDLFDERSVITPQRLRGYRDAAAEQGITIPSERTWHVPDNNHELGYQAAREALSCSPRPKVLLCMSDRIALAAIQAARHLNLRVPEDVKITGFDDIPEASTQHPSLTTVHQQSIDKGRIAAEIFQGKRLETNVVLSTELIVRQSCP